MKVSQTIDDLIIAYLGEELDPEGRTELEAWLEESEENRAYFARIQDLWTAFAFPARAGEYDVDGAFELFRDRHLAGREDQPAASSPKESRRGRRWISALWRFAVAAAVTALVSILSYHGGQRSLRQRFARVQVEAPQGSVTRMTLPDGTQVQLNACSSLSWSQGFGLNDRNVTLRGECYFEVAHDEALPFVVTSDHLAVRVLGTRFDFRDYPNDMEVSVSLVEGKVSLVNLCDPDRAEKYLNPGQQVIFDKQSGSMRIDTNDAANASLWTQGVLFFDEVTLYDIARELERCYNVKIHISDEQLCRLRIYGNFHSREQRIENILDLLTATHNFRYRISGHEITLY